MNIEEVPKYRKKRSKTAAPKSSHKHIYEDCLLVYVNEIPFKACYCTICGRIGKVQFAVTERTSEGCHVMLTHSEVLEKYKHLKQFNTDTYNQKFVDIGGGGSLWRVIIKWTTVLVIR